MANKSRVSDFKEPYLALRRNVGWLAMGLPIVVVLGAWIFPPNVGIQGSVSAYYHTSMRDVFVGVLCATGVFLLTYNPGSYDKSYRKGKRNFDQIFGIMAGIFAIGVALFPTTRNQWETLPPVLYNESLFGILHGILAASLFLILTGFSYFLFTKSDKKYPGPNKERSNRIYKTCGLIMLACVFLMGGYTFYTSRLQGRPDPLEPYHLVFILEGLASLAFGVSWFVKGDALSHYPKVIRNSAKEIRKSADEIQKSGLKTIKKAVKSLQAN